MLRTLPSATHLIFEICARGLPRAAISVAAPHLEDFNVKAFASATPTSCRCLRNVERTACGDSDTRSSPGWRFSAESSCRRQGSCAATSRQAHGLWRSDPCWLSLRHRQRRKRDPSQAQIATWTCGGKCNAQACSPTNIIVPSDWTLSKTRQYTR